MTSFFIAPIHKWNLISRSDKVCLLVNQSLSLIHPLSECKWPALNRSDSQLVSRSLRHHLWSCLHRSGSGVSLITSSSVNMSSPVWKWCLAHYVIICDHVFAGLEVFLAHYVIICDHVFAGLEVVSRSLRHHLWSCLHRSGSGVSLITSSSVIMSSPVWKWCLAHYVIICDHVFAGLEVFLAHYVIICDHVFAGLEVVSRSLRHHLWSCLRRSGSVSRSLRHHLWSCLHRSGSVSRSLRHH